MKARELIEYLKRVDPEAPVFVKSYASSIEPKTAELGSVLKQDVVYVDMAHKRDIRTIEDPATLKQAVCIGHYDMQCKEPKRKPSRKALHNPRREIVTTLTFDPWDGHDLDKAETKLVEISGHGF
jgi:hypothetical protein